MFPRPPFAAALASLALCAAFPAAAQDRVPIDLPTVPAWDPPVVLREEPDAKPIVDDHFGPAWLKSGRASVTYLPPDTDGLAWTDIDVRTSLGLPNNRALSITPRFGIHWAEGTRGLNEDGQPADIPGQLFDVSADISLAVPLCKFESSSRGIPRWLLLLGVSPGLYTDGENTSGDAFRIPGRAMAVYSPSDHWSWAVGAVYLDREDVPAIPAVGFIYKPDGPDGSLVFDVTLPRPKLSYRFQQCGDAERWASISGEFGGGQWAVERDDGSADQFRYRDFRLLFGLEHRTAAGPVWLTQFGVAFGRELEYESEIGDRSLNSTAVMRVGAQF